MTALTARLLQSVAHGDVSRPTIQLWAGVLALVPMGAVLGHTIGTNTPLGPRLPLHSMGASIEAAAFAGPAVAAILLGFTADDDLIRVALLFAGVFGGLSLLSQTAMVPTTIAVGAAGVLVVLSQSDQWTDRRELIQRGVTLAFGFGLVVSMIGAMGVEPALTRQLASVSIAVAIAGTPAYTGYSRKSVFVGLLGGALIAVIGLKEPIMTAAVSLLGMGIVGLPLGLLVLGAIGGVTAIASGIERQSIPNALAGLLVLVAGVPATIPSAVALLVALGLFVEGPKQ